MAAAAVPDGARGMPPTATVTEVTSENATLGLARPTNTVTLGPYLLSDTQQPVHHTDDGTLPGWATTETTGTDLNQFIAKTQTGLRLVQGRDQIPATAHPDVPQVNFSSPSQAKAYAEAGAAYLTFCNETLEQKYMAWIETLEEKYMAAMLDLQSENECLKQDVCCFQQRTNAALSSRDSIAELYKSLFKVNQELERKMQEFEKANGDSGISLRYVNQD
ncbi:uncharacterized protein BDV14DRAFT_203810 [Aspergillus stella-maris]|uniref:uncharacterized protein n=1 Tax=Aspergillus stella-maris TaxID=1810926 RepID=UPI003CCE29A0